MTTDNVQRVQLTLRVMDLQASNASPAHTCGSTKPFVKYARVELFAWMDLEFASSKQ